MSALLSIGKTAMFASYAALQTAGNNIANANTPGYSRQRVEFADAPSQYTGGGFFGKGVDLTTVSRAYDQFLTNHAVATSSTAAADASRLDQLNLLEKVFPTGSEGLGSAVGTFLNGFVDLANNPSDTSARQVVLSNAQAVAGRFKAAADQLSVLQRGGVQDVQTAVASVNSLAQQVAALNQQITTMNGSGQPPNQLLDARDQLVSEISEYLSVSTVKADDGSVGLFIGGGQSLVLGANASTLKAVQDCFDPAKVQLAVATGGADRLIPADSLSGGSIAGSLRFQNDDLVAATNLLGQMATAFSGAINAQQALGLDGRQPPGSGAPMFSVGAPRVLPAFTNAGNASLSLTVSDASYVQASDYELRFDGSNYNLVRLSDQQSVGGSPLTPAQLSAGVQVDGLTLQLAAGTSQPGDRYLLQPTSAAASQMQATLSDPQGLAAASPFTASVGSANTGTAAIESMNAVSPGYVGSVNAAITFTNDTGAYSWTLSAGTPSSGTGQWNAGDPIALNGFELELSGVPKSGDTVAVVPTASVASNNGNALALFNLGTEPILGFATTPSASVVPGRNITDAYASVLSNIGVRVQSAKSASAISGAIAQDAQTARSNSAGVNLDEEAARLIQYQQSYQAAAKILQVAQSIFDTLLQAAAR
jgi:flagellar hook-associated protein 1 FlgK